jgi:hypothetical protein
VSGWVGPRDAAIALPRARTRVRLQRAVHPLGSRSGEAAGEQMAAHSGQGLPRECHRLKAHTREQALELQLTPGEGGGREGWLIGCTEVAQY